MNAAATLREFSSAASSAFGASFSPFRLEGSVQRLKRQSAANGKMTRDAVWTPNREEGKMSPQIAGNTQIKIGERAGRSNPIPSQKYERMGPWLFGN